MGSSGGAGAVWKRRVSRGVLEVLDVKIDLDMAVGQNLRYSTFLVGITSCLKGF